MITPPSVAPSQPFVPVVVGADLGTYSIARAFHAEHGVRTVVVSRVATGPVRWSRIVDHSPCADLGDDAALLAHLTELAAELDRSAPGRPLLLLGCADHLVRRLLTLRSRLEPRWTLPYVNIDLFDRMSSKDAFAALCKELDVAHPETEVVDLARPGAAAEDAPWRRLTAPYVVKPVDAPLYAELGIPGAEKVHTCERAEDVVALLERMRAGGYHSPVVVQSRIDGDDQQMRILTCYSDRTGTVRFAGFGRVLLEEHTPATQGNPAAILTEVDAGVVAEAVRLLEHVGWVGYANFDLKVDRRTGRTVFFELNPRLGRSNFYLTGAGYNVARQYVRDWVTGEPITGRDRLVVADREFLYSIVPTPMLAAYVADPAVRRRVAAAVLRGRSGNPLLYPADLDPRRVAWVKLNELGHVRKFARFHPPSRVDRHPGGGR